MSDWILVLLAAIPIIHHRQIARHGSAPGTRDPALLEMGSARALNRAAFKDVDLFEIAAAYAYGIAKAHAFVDGNKRTAFTFLRLNGVFVRPDPAIGVRRMEDLASEDLTENAFAAW